MHNGVHVRTLLHDCEVQENLAGSLATPGDLVAFHVHDAQVRRFHKTFRYHRGRAEHLVGAQSHRNVAVVTSGETLVVNPATDVADFIFELGK